MSAIGQPACATCKFYTPPNPQDPGANGIGECRRYPPRVDHVMVALEKGTPSFHRIVQVSMTHMSNWCGEYVAKIGGSLPPRRS